MQRSWSPQQLDERAQYIEPDPAGDDPLRPAKIGFEGGEPGLDRGLEICKLGAHEFFGDEVLARLKAEHRMRSPPGGPLIDAGRSKGVE